MQEYQFTKIRQAFDRPIIQDIEATVQAQVSAKLNIAPGARMICASSDAGALGRLSGDACKPPRR